MVRLKNWKIGVSIFLFTSVAAVCKKMPYVEHHEQGFIDTALMLIIVLLIALFVVLYAEIILNYFKTIKKAVMKLGEFSYELYLAHSVFLDILRKANLKGDGRLVALLMFIVFTAITAIALKFFVSWILSIKRLNRRESSIQNL